MLAGKDYLRMMLDARRGGFEIVLVYIGTEDVEINLARIRNRVWREVTTFHRQTSGDVINPVSQISRLR